MKDLLGTQELWYPLQFMGITHQASGVDIHILKSTWLSMAVLLILLLVGRYFIARPTSIGGTIVRTVIRNLIDLIEQSVGKFVFRYYTFISSIFIFIMACNWIGLIPGIEEPTKDLNTTLALGLIAFFYAQKEIIKIHGFASYLKEYFMPFSFVFPLNLLAGLAVLPLKLLGELASIISISFRLFGNIFGGAIITSIYQQAVSGSILFHILGLITGLEFILTLFFILFEGFLQAFVFSILALTNIAMAVQQEAEHEEAQL